MAIVTREEVLKIAAMSNIELQEDEINGVMQQLNNVLAYASCVKEVAVREGNQSNKATNVWRADQVIPTDPTPMLDQAPETQERYFVVPRILDNH